MTLTEMEGVLAGIMSGDNNQRQQAEAMFNKGLESNIVGTANSLIQALSESQKPDVRGLAAVLMRKKYVSQDEKLQSLGPQFHNQFKQQLLTRFQTEDNNSAIKHLCDLIVEFASSDVVQWPELFSFLVQNFNLENSKIVNIIYILGELVSINHCQMAQPDIVKLVDMSGQAFSHKSTEVQMESIKMFGKAVAYVDNIQNYLNATSMILGILKNFLTTGDELNSQQLLQILVDIASDKPKLYKGCINEIIPIMEQIGMNENFDEDCRLLSLELLITLIEKQPSMVRRNQAYIETVVKVALQLMLSVEEPSPEEWNSEYDHKKVVDQSPCFDQGQVTLCRLAVEISIKKYLPILLPKMEQLMGHNAWKCKHAGLIAVAQTCELICQGGINKESIFERVAQFAKDQHFRVRYATVHCLGIMCTDFGKKFVNKFHNQILDIFMQCMDDRANPRLQAHAAICVVNLAERLSQKMLRPNLEKLLHKLFSVLNQNNAPKFLHENVLSAICEVADNAKSEFLKYYDTFMPPLIQILENCTSDDFIGLRQEALRAVSYIGMAVGKEKFGPVAIRALQLSMSIVQSEQEVTRVLNSWKRIFKTLGTDATELMPIVAEPMFKYATHNVTLCHEDDDLEVNDRDVNVNASLVEEKISAINLIDYMARYSDGGFMPLVERSASALLPLIADPMDTGIQEAALEALPSLVYCMFKHFKKHNNPSIDMIGMLVAQIITSINKSMPNEENVESLSSFACCIENLAAIDADLTKSTIKGELLQTTTNSLMDCLKRSVERMDMRNNAMREQGVDEEEIDKLKEGNNHESRLSNHISDSVNQFIKVYREEYLGLLAGSMDALSYMLGPEGLDIQKACALYIFCQVIECCDPKSYANLLDVLKKSFLESCGSADIAVRQAGLYGTGVFVEKLGSAIGIPMEQILKACFMQFADAKYMDGDVEDIQDNAAMTIGRVCKFCANDVDLPNVYAKWLKCFPIRNDDDCSQWCYAEFLRLIEENNTAFLGQNGDNLPGIVAHIADAAYTEFSNDEIDAKFGQLLAKIKNSPQADKVFSAIPADLKKKIASLS